MTHKIPPPPRSPDGAAARALARHAKTSRRLGESESLIRAAIGRAVVDLLSGRETVSAADIEGYYRERLASRPTRRHPELDAERTLWESVIREMRALSGN